MTDRAAPAAPTLIEMPDRSLRLRALSALLRLYEKPRLARLEDETGLRAGVERAAAALPQPPKNAVRREEPVRRARPARTATTASHGMAAGAVDGPAASAPLPEPEARSAARRGDDAGRSGETGAAGVADPAACASFKTEAEAPIPAVRWTGGRAGGAAASASSDDARRPVILYFHGGAFVAGTRHTHRSIHWRLVEDAGADLVAIEYGLGPEDPFPAAQIDAFDAYLGLLEEGIEPARIALAGDSAGGGLVFAVAGMLDAAGAPTPACLVAFSPFTDLTLSGDSLDANARADAMLPVQRFRELVERYLLDADPADPRASPILRRFRAPPPPTLIQVGGREVLLDDSRRMAETLTAAGGAATLEIWRWAPHAFPFFAPVLPEARRALARAAAFIRRHAGAEDIPWTNASAS